MIHTVRRFPSLAAGTLLLAAAPPLPGAGATVPTAARGAPGPDATAAAARRRPFPEERPEEKPEEKVVRLEPGTQRRAFPAPPEAGRPFVAGEGGAR